MCTPVLVLLEQYQTTFESYTTISASCSLFHPKTASAVARTTAGLQTGSQLTAAMDDLWASLLVQLERLYGFRNFLAIMSQLRRRRLVVAGRS